MAANPNPGRITEAQWWFVEQLLALEPNDTVFAGAWGNFKPGYHCDRNTLLNTPAWSNDYSIKLPADKRGPGQYGAAVDWTFKSAQAGNFTNIRKYGGRIRSAFLARDTRLKGWREVLCQGDGDDPADGYDFQSWTERTPDSTHRWHFHFSELRENVESYENKRAMLSVLRGTALGVDDDMMFFQAEDLSAGRMNGCTYQFAPNYETLLKWQAKYPSAPRVKVTRADLNAGLHGVNVDDLGGGDGGSGGVSADQARAIAKEEVGKAKVVPSS